MPRVLGPNGLQLPDTCQSCKFWIVRADDPQHVTRCSAGAPQLFTVQVPKVQEFPVDPPVHTPTG